MNRKKFKKTNSKNKLHISNNVRLTVVFAVIFLLFLATAFQLYNLQVRKSDLYKALASDQHEIYNKIKPERGEIFLSEFEKNKVYPLATNKNFYSVYCVPKDASETQDLAEKFYLVFDKKETEEEVKEEFEEKDFKNRQEEIENLKKLELEEEELKEEREKIKEKYENISDKELREMRIKREIESRKEKIINSYYKKLNKYNDPYEPIAKKIEEDKLLELYSYILSKDLVPININNLSLSNSQIYLENFTNINTNENVTIKANGQIHFPAVGYNSNSHRYYPEGEIGSHIVGFVNQNGDKSEGNYGLEGFFNNELFGSYGSLKSEKGGENSVIVSDREYVEPKNGNDLVLTIDRSVQFTVCKKLQEAIDEYEATGGTVIVVNPNDGSILAMCSWPSFDPNNYQDVEDIKVFNNPAIFYQYEPGSVFKSLTMAIALDQGKITPNTTYEDKGEIMIEGWPKTIKNSDFKTHGPHGLVDMNYALENSLNTGAIFAMKQVGAEKFSEYVKKFAFGEQMGIELNSEACGNMDNLLKDKIKPIDAATTSFGQGIAVTPLQMVMSYAAIANDGILLKPHLVKKVIKSDGSEELIKKREIRRVVSQKASELVSGMMVNVIEAGHAKKAKVDGYYIGGKTGTAQVASSQGGYSEDKFIHSFIGIAPIDQPEFVTLVKLDNPEKVEYSSESAAPLFGEINNFLLKYYQIPKTRK